MVAGRGIEDDEQLAHAGNEGYLERLASGDQPWVDSPDDCVAGDGGERSHAEDAPYVGQQARTYTFVYWTLSTAAG